MWRHLFRLIIAAFPSLLFAQVDLPKMDNPFPIDLLSGRLVYVTSRKLVVGPEEITIPVCYISPKQMSDSSWEIFGHRRGREVKGGDGWIEIDHLIFPAAQSVVCHGDEVIECKKENELFILKFTDGRMRVYEWYHPYLLRLVKERTSKGNWLVFRYSHKDCINKIDVMNRSLNRCYGTITIQYENEKKKDPSFTIKNGEKKHYFHYMCHGDQYYLNYIEDHKNRREFFRYKRFIRKGFKRKKRYLLDKIEYSSQYFMGFIWDEASDSVESIWSKGLDGKLIQLAKVTYMEGGGTYHFCDGRLQDYTYDKKGRILKTCWGEFTKVCLYNKKGYLASETFSGPSKSVVKRNLKYDGKGRISEEELVSKGEKWVQRFDFDSLNRVVGIHDSCGKKQLVSYHNDTGLVATRDDGCMLIEKEYDQDGLLKSTRCRDHHFVDHTTTYQRKNFQIVKEDHKDRSITYAYDEYGNVVSKETFDCMGNLASWERYAYDDKNLVTEKESSSGKRIFFTYDHFDRVAEEQVSDLTTTYVYDQFSRVRLIRKRDKNGRCIEEAFEYTPFGKVRTFKDKLGHIISYAYNELGQKISDESGYWKLDVFGKRGYFVDLLGRKTTYKNGLYPESSESVFCDGSKQTWKHENFGRKRIFTDECGCVVSCLYDRYDRLLLRQCQNRVTRFVYAGKKLVEIHENGVCIAKFVYDPFGRIEKEFRLGHKKQYFYNHLGHLSSMIEDGKTILFQRDGLGRVVSKWDGMSYYAYEYEENGDVSFIKHGKGNEEIERRQVHDGFGNLCAQYQPSGSVIEWKRKVRGETKVDERGRKTQSIFDKRGRLIKKVHLHRKMVEEFTYDLVGNLTCKKEEIEGKCHQANYTYDQRNRLTRIEDAYGVHEKRYDSRGDLIWERRQNGNEISYEYNKHRELIHLTSSDNTISYRYEYDQHGQVVKTVDEITGAICTRNYDKNRNLVQEVLENGLVMKYDYLHGKKSLVTLPDLSKIQYVYQEGEMSRVYRIDCDGEIVYDHLTTFDTRAMPVREEMIMHLGVVKKAYDRDLQLKQITTPYHHQTITKKDEVGNVLRVRSDIKETSFQVDRGDCLIGEKAEPVKRVNGRAVKACGKEFRYDALDRLIEIRCGGKTITFKYDAFHRIVASTCNGQESRYFYDELIEIGSVDKVGNVKELRVLGFGKQGDMGKSVAIELDGEVYAPLHDLFGSVIGLVSQEKEIVGRYNASVFGDQEKVEGIVSPWRFGSKRVDKNSCVVLYGFRAYLPSCHEFCQLDHRCVGGELDLTHFNHKNPLTNCDPWGLDAVMRRDQNVSITFDNTLITPTFPVSLQPVEGLFDHDKIFTPNKADIRHFPGREFAPKDHAVVVVNGIRNTEEDCCWLAMRVANNYSGKIVSVYNQSNGIWNDLARMACEYIKLDTAPVLNLRSALQDLHDCGYENIHLINHSEGGLIAKRALEKLPYEVRDKVNVFSLGAPTLIPQCYAKTIQHYYSSQDTVDKLAAFPYLIELLKGHKISYQYEHSQMVKFGEHALSSPTYSLILDQVLESIENSS